MAIQRSQIRLAAVTGSLVDISNIANAALSAQGRLEAVPAEQVQIDTLDGILGQMGAAIKRIQGDSDKDFTEVQAGVFKHEVSVFSGSMSLKNSSGIQQVSITSSGVVSASSDILAGGMITGSAGMKLAGDLDVNSTADFQGSVQFQSTINVDQKATLASAMVEDLNVAGGLVFTDGSGNLDNDSKVIWDGSSFKVDGAVSGSGNFLVGGGLTVAGIVDVNSTLSASAIKIDGDVAQRLYIVDADGSLKDEANLTFNGSELDITGALDVSGAADIGGDFSVATNKMTVASATGNTAIAGTLDIIGKISGSTAEFSGEIRAATAKIDSLSQPGVVIAGANGLLTTTASLFYTENRLEVSSSVRISGDMAVNGEGGVADITSTAAVAAIFDSGVDTIFIGADAELIQVGEQGGLVDFAGDIRMTGSLSIMGAGAEFIDRLDGGSLAIRGGSLTGSVGKVTVTLSGSDLRFDDGYRAGWDSDIKFAGSESDWTRFKNIFGEASILQAISNAAALPTDAKFMYKVTGNEASPTILTGDIVRQVGGAHFSASYAAVPTGSRNENVDVFLNGQLLVSKSYDSVNYDYDVAPNGSSISFNFSLQPDDFISILVPVTVASVADYVAASGAGGSSGGGGAGATNLDGLTDVAITSPSNGQVLKYNGSSWINDAPPAAATDLDSLTDVAISSPSSSQVIKYNGTAWANASISYDIAGSVAGLPAASEILLRAPIARGTSFASGYAYCEVTPTSQVVLTIAKGINSAGSVSYSSIGTITFEAAATVGTVSITGGTASFSAGDILRIVAPGSQDATFASPSFALIGSEA
jgi:hypothetical protein